ncbi:MAG: translation initiation factor IF-2 associated domain-containing protein, partial [Nitrosomonas sp.]
MAQISVEQFANELGLQPTVLLEQLKAAGVKKIMAEDALTEQDKTQLLEYLRKTHGASESKSKITLTHRQTSEIRKSDSTGRPRTIQIEVRKKRVLQKATVQTLEEAPKPIPEVAVTVSTSSTQEKTKEFMIDAEELALRKEEARKQAELIARQTEEIQLKKTRKKTEKPDDVKKEPQPVASVAGNPSTTNESTAQSPKSAESAATVSSEKTPESKAPTASPGNLSSEGTLHKPVVAATEKKKKPTKEQSVWKDDSIKKRGFKTRGEVSNNQGWRASPRKDRHSKQVTTDESNLHAFSAPTEPI